MNKRQTSEYIATMRRLLDTAKEENLWIILSTTPEGVDHTNRLDPSLIQRFAERYEIPPLTEDDARYIVEERLKRARFEDHAGLWPFHEDTISTLSQTTRSSPRRLIKVLWESLNTAVDQRSGAPISLNTVQAAEDALFPGSNQ